MNPPYYFSLEFQMGTYMPFMAPFLMGIVQSILPILKQRYNQWKKKNDKESAQKGLLKLKKKKEWVNCINHDFRVHLNHIYNHIKTNHLIRLISIILFGIHHINICFLNTFAINLIPINIIFKFNYLMPIIFKSIDHF